MIKKLRALTLLALLLSGTARAQDAALGKAPPTNKKENGGAKEKEKELSAEERLFEEGRDAMFQGDYPKAIEQLKKAVAADKAGTRTIYRLHLARAYRYAGQPAPAVELLKGILKQTVDHVEAGQLLGEIYHEQKQWKEIIATLEPLLTFRHDYSTYHMLAEAAYFLDDYPKARKYYREAIALNASSAPDHYQLGNIDLAQNRFALAAAAYERAIALGLESPVLHYKLASAYFNLRNYFGGISSVTIKSGQPGSISDGWYLIEAVPGRRDVFRVAPPQSAIFQITKAIDTGLAEGNDARMLLANIYLNAGRHKRARELFAAAGAKMADAPKQERALYHYSFAQSAFGIGNYDEYLQQLKQAIDLDPEAYKSALIDAYVSVADKHNQAGQLDRYLEYLTLAVQASPQNAALHLKLGEACEEARQYDKAVIQWQMVLDLEPEHPERTRLLNQIKKYRQVLSQKNQEKKA